MSMRSFLLIYFLFVLYPLLSLSECPNACSAHGACGPYDMCICDSNWMEGDCSQRMCQFGRAHADTPIGDLDASKSIAGPGYLVSKNSHLYPYGTQEQYPLMATTDGEVLTNTAHPYRECSNKGYCDRSRGVCDCLIGYEGVACQRASCYNSCSGNGVCLTAEELAAIDGNNVYELWDKDMTMGCHCDKGYEGPDCSQRVCKMGVDPMYDNGFNSVQYTNISYVIYTKSITASIEGNYSLIFYDVYGEDWETDPINYNADCSTITASIEALPNNVIRSGSIHCLKWDNYYNISSSDEPILVEPNAYHGIKYTLLYSSNPGKLKQLQVNTHLSGMRPSLFSTETNASTLGIFIYPNGFTGEATSHFNRYCKGVDVTILTSDDARYNYFGDLTTDYELRLLAACLGDADGSDVTYSSTGSVLGVDYSWDYGTIYNPHLIKLVDLTKDKHTDLCPPSADTSSNIRDTSNTTICSIDNTKTLSPGMYAAVIYDSVLGRFILFSDISADYDDATLFGVMATSGTAQMVSNEAKIKTMSTPYMNVVMTKPDSTTLTAFNGNIDCEFSSPLYNANNAFTCISKGDRVFILDPSLTTRSFLSNPKYMNLYTVEKVYVEHGVAYGRGRVSLDYSINAQWIDDDDHARMYKFTPIAADQYTYVSKCANRGTCNTKTGLCSCYNGYQLDDCTLIYNPIDFPATTNVDDFIVQESVGEDLPQFFGADFVAT